MKRVAIYGKYVTNEFRSDINKLLAVLKHNNIEVIIYNKFKQQLCAELGIDANYPVFRNHRELKKIDLLFSIGGDGTFLDSTRFIRSSGTPILGVNTGRLGFLSRVSTTDLDQALEELIEGSYQLEPRALLKLETNDKLFGLHNNALNEVTIHKKDSSSMIIIHTYLNDEFFNSYWADGLIISTPTGATAYSMSCGGPIIMPGSNNFVITPVAPHNLNVRPFVVPDDAVLKLQLEGRGDQFLIGLDSRTETVTKGVDLSVSKSDFKINLVKLKGHSFMKTLREKLNWGLDTRN